MKKKQVKKYAHELLKSMSFRSDARDMGYPHYKKTRALPIKGKRARRIMVDEMDYASKVERRLAPTGKDYFVCGDWNHHFRFPGSEKSGVWGYGRELWYSHGDAWRQGNLEVYYRGEWHKVVGDAKHTDTRPAD